MKKVLIILFVIMSIMLASCGKQKEETYTKQEMQKAIAEAKHEAYERGYEKGYDEGYDLAAYEYRGEIEEAQRYADDGYVYGYENGYMDGYDDCLVEHGLVKPETYIPQKKIG